MSIESPHSTKTKDLPSPTSEVPVKMEHISGMHQFIETKRGKFTVAGAGFLAAAGLVFGGIKMGEGSSSTEDVKPQPTSSSQEVAPPQEVTIPAEAKDFVDAYGTRYADPVATYYAEVAYEQESGGDSYTIGDEYINNYDFESTTAGGKSPLGFDLLDLSPGTTIDVPTSVDQFNTALPTMNRVINLLAKNPTPGEVAVITDEFKKYSGYGFEDNSSNLVVFFNEVISKYGSASNYTIKAASSETTDSSHATTFNPDRPPTIDSNDKSGGVGAFHNQVTLSISVDSYDSTNKKTSTVDITENFSFMVQRAPEGIDPLHGGFIGIGTQ